MIQQITITYLKTFDKDKNGNPLKSKDGRPYQKLSIKTVQHGDKYLSGFVSEWNKNWKVGDDVSADVNQNGEYLNFSKVNTESVLLEKVNALEAKMIQVVAEIKKINAKTTSAGTKVPDFSEVDQKTEQPVDDINPEDIPF